ncbi:DgyrCDS12840 [Dimorphilus gyrociliatus]|uniref:DgyrCDS12840 n=1 Tax=Dimorphilus gyrociliatus TaxID=2664684 RepID=A0A7I8W8V8_9ANNE|nr:DgyrCDS12840 [Dimorphilus gyrociliatus]
MNIIFRFIILCLKVFIDFIGDLVGKFGLKLTPLTFEGICSSLSKEAKSEFLQTDYLRNNCLVFIENSTANNIIPLSGQYFLRVWLTQLMELHVRVKKYLKMDPTVSQVPIKRPVFILTLIRTGSTFLHHLMNQDENWKCPELWELEDCAPSPGDNAEEDKRRIAYCKFKWDVSSVLMGWNDIKKYHSLDPHNPEDLIFNIYSDFNFIVSNLIHEGMEGEFTKYFSNPSKKNSDLYDENLKLRLQMICKNANMDRRRLLTMHHVTPVNLESLIKAFPDAQFITIHRDPVGQIKSACELVRVMSRSCRRHFNNDRVGFGRRVLKGATEDGKKLVNWRKSNQFKTDEFKRFIDIQFKDLIKTPMKVVEDLYKDLDMTLTNSSKEKMKVYLDNYEKKTGKSKYNLKEYGLSEEKIQESMKFYTDFFQV